MTFQHWVIDLFVEQQIWNRFGEINLTLFPRNWTQPASLIFHVRLIISNQVEIEKNFSLPLFPSLVIKKNEIKQFYRRHPAFSFLAFFETMKKPTALLFCFILRRCTQWLEKFWKAARARLRTWLRTSCEEKCRESILIFFDWAGALCWLRRYVHYLK